MYKSILFVAICLGASHLSAWEEDPRLEEADKRTAYLLKLGNAQAGVSEEPILDLSKYLTHPTQKIKDRKYE